ncbi:DUF7507 domain-containing protein [Paenibacillus glycanilyticus]|uniref:DUF11 domain-containing protein n=1 Tax=Paenibacillus glycanilyticus TaxID=126569 RepID=A0ABQ6GHH2_9BACL|nr:hypothetical protein [Paenibacillus glycanilyticus]GLX70374.1 hypothetical protein MU1_47200 [Paenibacillus glycanilyticus]
MLTGIKTSDVPVAFVGDIITYTLQITNTGSTTAENIILSESVPAGTSVIPGSIYANNVPQFGTNPLAIDLDPMPPGASTTVTLEVHINVLPDPPQAVNQALIRYDAAATPSGPLLPQTPVVIPPHVLPIVSPDLSASKLADRMVTAPGDLVAYTVTATNSGNTNLSGVTIVDPVPAGTQLVAGTVTVNGALLPGADPAAGIPTGNLLPGQSTIAQYQVRIEANAATQSATQSVSNQAQITYVPDLPGRSLQPSRRLTNQVVIPVLSPNLSVFLQGAPSEAAAGDTIGYSLLVTNTGNTGLTGLIATDTLPAGTSFIAGSVTLNGAALAQGNPASGISLGSLTPGQSTNLTFQAVLVSTTESTFANQAQVAFTPDIPGLVLPFQTRSSNQVVTAVIEEEE